MLRQTPIGVGSEMDHLVDDRISHPGTLLAGGTVDKGIMRIQLDGADTCREDAVQLIIAATETGAFLPMIDMFFHSKIG